MKNFLLWIRRTGLICAGIVCATIACTSMAHAATDTSQSQTVTATISSAASLTLGSNTVTFSSSSGAGAMGQTESGASLNVTANARTASSGSVTLTVLATQDLTDVASDTIPISNLTWVGTGAGFAASGTADKVTGQSVGSWTGPGVYTGTMTFSLANSWTYPSGSYTTTLNYTLTAP